ncbi:MAG: putative selenate ABC transporter substrate-binding protein [Candidatus Velthaea sp.]
MGENRIVEATRRRFLSAASASVAGIVVFPARAVAAGDLRVAFIPEVATTSASISEKQPFVDYLAKATGRTVKLVIPTNYAATVEAIGNESLDLAHFGGLTYLKAQQRYNVKPLVQRLEDRRFHSLFVTNSPAVMTLKDLRGKTFAFGDVNSTSGHLIPARELIESGIDPERDITARYSGNHTNTAIAVNAGQVVAGALDESVYAKLLADRTIDAQRTRVFVTSKPFVDYVWAVRRDLDGDLITQLRHAFLQLSDPKVLAILRGTKYVTANDTEYESLRSIAKRVGLL